MKTVEIPILYGDEWLTNEYARLERDRLETLNYIDELFTIDPQLFSLDPEIEMEELKNQMNKKFDAEKQNALMVALGKSTSMNMSFKEVKQKSISQIANCIWFNPHIDIEDRLAFIVSLNALSEDEATKLISFQKHKQKDISHKIILREKANDYDSFFFEATECLKKYWRKEKRKARAILASKSKLMLWLNDLQEDWTKDFGQIKEFFTNWVISILCVGIISYLFIEHSLGMPDLAEIFVVAGTVIIVMHLSTKKKKELMQEIDSERSDFQRRLIIYRESYDFPVVKVLLILLVMVFVLYMYRGFPDSIPHSIIDPTDPAGPCKTC